MAKLFSKEKTAQMEEQLKDNYYNPEKKAKHRKNVRKGFCVTLIIMLLSSVLNWGIITGWGNVRIDRLKLVGSDGAEFSALIYVPKNATNETPAPALLCFHGNAGNARNHEAWAVEMSRRGYVVLSVDQYGAGDSQGTFDGSREGALSEEAARSVSELYTEYIMSLSIVDQDNIICSGHSMGATAAVYSAQLCNAKMMFWASGVNFATDAWTGNFVHFKGLVEDTEENFAATNLTQIQNYEEYADLDSFELGTLYGSFEEGNAYIADLEPNRIHEAAFVSKTTIGHLIEYCQLAVGDSVPNYIDSEDQIWPYKDYAGLFGIFAFGAFVAALALLLIEEVPAFAIVKRPIARNIGLRGIGFGISAILGIIFPYIVLKTDALGIVGGSFYDNLRFTFKMGYSNMAFGTIVGLNILGLCGFIFYYVMEGKKKKLHIRDLGLTPEKYDSMKTNGEKALSVVQMVVMTLLLSAVVIAISWGYIQLQEEVAGTAFYAYFFGVKEIPIAKIPYYMNYLVIWIICFVIASFTLNVERRLPSTGNDNLDTVLQMAINIILGIFTLTLIVAVKWYLQTIGSDADTNIIWNMGLDTQRIWGMPVGMTVGIGGSTFLYKKTGNTWLSAILMGTVACLMCVLFGGTRFHFLTFFVS